MQMETSTNIVPASYGQIYRATNKINGKMYHGQTTEKDIKRRWYRYKNLNCKNQPKLYPALKKYGPENFLFEVIDTTPQDQIQLDNLEIFYIAKFDSFHNGYNANEGGHGGKKSEETKKKISISLKGRSRSKEAIRKFIETRTGSHHSEETKRKMSIAKQGEKSYMFGKHMSEETKKKISDALINIPRSDEIRCKISKANLGKHHSEESKLKMSRTRKGIPCSEEAKKKISDAMIRHYSVTTSKSPTT